MKVSSRAKWESQVVSRVIISLINNWNRQRILIFSIILFILVVLLKCTEMLYITMISTALNQIKQTIDIIISKTMHTFWRVLVICSFTLKLHVGLDLIISCFINFILFACISIPNSYSFTSSKLYEGRLLVWLFDWMCWLFISTSMKDQCDLWPLEYTCKYIE